MRKIVMPKITPILLLFLLLISLLTFACSRKSDESNKADESGKTAEPEKSAEHKRSNILLIIGDDFGVDVTSDMYPGLIEDLEKKYGPSGYNHPDYKKIKGLTGFNP